MSRFQENFQEIRKNANAKRVEKIFRNFFLAFFKYRKYCGGVSILSNPPRYRYYRIGIDTFDITSHYHAIHHAVVSYLRMIKKINESRFFYVICAKAAEYFTSILYADKQHSGSILSKINNNNTTLSNYVEVCHFSEFFLRFFWFFSSLLLETSVDPNM